MTLPDHNEPRIMVPLTNFVKEVAREAAREIAHDVAIEAARVAASDVVQAAHREMTRMVTKEELGIHAANCPAHDLRPRVAALEITKGWMLGALAVIAFVASAVGALVTKIIDVMHP